MQHPEHYTLYRDDLLCAGFQHQQWTLMLDIVRQHYPGTPLSVAEIGAGTGGLTLQVCSISTGCTPAMLMMSSHHTDARKGDMRASAQLQAQLCTALPEGEGSLLPPQVLRDLCQAAPGLEHYVATDIIPGCGPPLLKAANNPKLSFEACSPLALI